MLYIYICIHRRPFPLRQASGAQTEARSRVLFFWAVEFHGLFALGWHGCWYAFGWRVPLFEAGLRRKDTRRFSWVGCVNFWRQTRSSAPGGGRPGAAGSEAL